MLLHGEKTTICHSSNITSLTENPQSMEVCAEWSKVTGSAVPRALLSHGPSVALELLKLLRLWAPPHEFPPPNAKFPLLSLETHLLSPISAQLLPTQNITLSLQKQLPSASFSFPRTHFSCPWFPHLASLCCSEDSQSLDFPLLKSMGRFMTNAA